MRSRTVLESDERDTSADAIKCSKNAAFLPSRAQLLPNLHHKQRDPRSSTTAFYSILPTRDHPSIDSYFRKSIPEVEQHTVTQTNAKTTTCVNSTCKQRNFDIDDYGRGGRR
jgi:hypothetical protein